MLAMDYGRCVLLFGIPYRCKGRNLRRLAELINDQVGKRVWELGKHEGASGLCDWPVSEVKLG